MNNNNFSTSWVKYSDYEFKTLEDEIYIVPTKGAKQEMYDPFDVKDKILIDILNIGRTDETDKTTTKILEFVKNYGLLGLLNYYPLNSNILQQDKVFLNKVNDITTEEIINTEDYINNFLKANFNNEIELLKKRDQGFGVCSNKIQPTDLLNYNLELTIIFSIVYSEKLSWILNYAKQMYNTFLSIELYYQDKKVENKKMTEIFIDNLKPYNLSCNIVLEDKPQLQWNFNSLRLAIDTIFTLEMTSEKKKLKLCKHCWKPFYSENIKSEYCSTKCRNQANVYKSRAKNSK